MHPSTLCYFWISILAVLCCASAFAKDPELAKPTPEQLAWQDFEVGLMIHLGPSTWENTQQDENTLPLEKINPTKLDTDQWVRAAELIGAKYVVLTAKHSGGFCVWQTDTTDYSIKNTPWRGGKGDIVRDMAESCRKKGIKLGIYLSPADRKHGAPLTWGTDWPGQQGHTAKPEDQAAYDKLFRAQLKELMSRYGEVVELWFDGGTVTEIGDILKEYPKTLVVGGKYTSVRTAGEDGFAPYPNWSSVKPGGKTYIPVECPVPTRDTWYWFWNPNTDHMLKSTDQLVTIYYNTVGHNANLLLSVGPDQTGLIPEIEMQRFAEFGAEIRRRFAHSVAETEGRGETLELPLRGAPMKADLTIDHVIIMEDLSQGERVVEYVVEGLVGEQWRELCRGSSIGHKKIDRFAPVMCSKLRLRCMKTLAEPAIRKFAAHNTCWDWWKGGR